MVIFICGVGLIGAGLVALTLIPVAVSDIFTKDYNRAGNVMFAFAFTFAAVSCLWMGWHLLVS